MLNRLRAVATRLNVFANRTPNRGIALVANTLSNILWLIDTTWSGLVRESYGRNAVVYACVRLLSQSVPEAPLKVYRKGAKPGEKEEVGEEHPAQALIHHPNECMTEYEMMELATIQLAVVGRTVWWKERGNAGQVIGLWPLRPDRVGPIYALPDAPEGQKLLAGWSYQDPDGRGWTPIPRRDALSINWPDPDGETGGIAEGLGPLSVLRAEISADNHATKHVGALLANYGQPGVVLKVQNSPTEEEGRLMKALFRHEFGGTNIGTPAVVGDGAEIQILGFSLKDLEFPGLRDNAEARVCSALGVPAILVGAHVGLKETNQKSTVKELREYFTETTVAAYWRRYADQFTLDLVAEFGEGLFCEFDTSNVKALAGQFAEKLTPYKEAFTAGAITVNQYLSKLQLDALPPEVGDVLYVPNTVTVVPVTPQAKAILDKQKVDIEAEAQARQQRQFDQQRALAEVQQPKALPPGGEQPEEGEEAATGRAPARASDEEAPRPSAKALPVAAIKDALDPRDAAELRLMRALEELFARQAPEVAAKLARGEMPTDAELGDALGRIIEVQLVETATAEGIRLAAEVGVQFDPAAVNAKMAEWAKTYRYELVKGLNETTRKGLQQVMGRFAETPGMTRGKLEKGIIEALTEPGGAPFSSVRAEAIAQTEVTRSYSASQLAYQQELDSMGIKTERVWVTTNDEIVQQCPICWPKHMKPESVWKGDFPSGPPGHVRCRCSTIIRHVEVA